MTDDRINSIKLSNYKNSTEILPGITMEDLIRAALIARLNTFLIGETGEGKTQLENDIMALFGDRGFFEQGRNDLAIKEMFTTLNLEKLKTAKTTEEVKELTGNARRAVYVIDELTRCIPAVQNQFFNLGDGFITIDGKKYHLDVDGYSVLVASGNVGNGKYVGTSETDRALLDRMHLIVDVDQFPKTSNDTLDILIAKKDPRVSEGIPDDKFELIKSLNHDFRERRPSLMQLVAAMYLVHGLDYVENLPGQSKRKNKNGWPGNVGGHSKGSDAALIFPFSTRASISTLRLAMALEDIKKAKGDAYDQSIESVFDAAYLIGAQSGVLHSSAIEQYHSGNPYAAMQEIIDGIRTEFMDESDGKFEVLKQAIKKAQSGEVAYLDRFTGRWAYMKDIIERTARECTKNE